MMTNVPQWVKEVFKHALVVGSAFSRTELNFAFLVRAAISDDISLIFQVLEQRLRILNGET